MKYYVTKQSSSNKMKLSTKEKRKDMLLGYIIN